MKKEKKRRWIKLEERKSGRGAEEIWTIRWIICNEEEEREVMNRPEYISKASHIYMVLLFTLGLATSLEKYVLERFELRDCLRHLNLHILMVKKKIVLVANTIGSVASILYIYIYKLLLLSCNC